MDKKTIVFTGGHHNSALILAKMLRKKGYQIYWFGHKHTMGREKSLSLEFQEIKKAGFPFIELKTGKFYRHFNPFAFVKIIYGFIQAIFYLEKIKPDLVVSFGGYLSVPVVLTAWILRIDCLLHEQTSRVGLANRFLAHFVKLNLITWPSSRKFFPPQKTKLVGLPLPAEIFQKQEIPLPFKEKLPVILVTGGKQGSHVINKIIGMNLEIILTKFNLIHQTGGVLKTGDFEHLRKLRRKLVLNFRQRYLLKKFFYTPEMVRMLKLADLVICRAGAHTVYELAALGKKALLIPFPWAYKDEQLANAQILVRAGTGRIIPQSKLSSKRLWREINYMLEKQNNLKGLREKAKKMVRSDASQEIIKIIEEIINK